MKNTYVWILFYSKQEKLNNVGSVKTDEVKINNLSQNLHDLIDNLHNNMTKMNDTFNSQILWLTNDQNKHRVRKLISEISQLLTYNIDEVKSI